MRPEVALWDDYGPLFSFEESEIFDQDTEEIDFYRDLAGRYGGMLLELGAGDGRLSRHLSAHSQVVALEPSMVMMGLWPESTVGGTGRIGARAQKVPLRSDSMDLVLFPYNGLHCILARDDRQLALREIRRILRPGGRMVMETCPKFSTRMDEERQERYDHEHDGRTLRLVESVSHDMDRELIIFHMEYSGNIVPGGRMDLSLELALISPGELLEDILGSDMRILSLWGNYDHSPWDAESSPRLLVMAGKE